MNNITAVLEWLNIFKGTQREYINTFKGTPLLTTEHFRQRVAERYPKDIEIILGINLTQFYEDVATDYRKYGKDKYHKGAIDYTTQCTNHEDEKFIVNLMVNYIADRVSAGRRDIDAEINKMREDYLKESNARKRSKLYKEFTDAVTDHIDPKYQTLVIRGKVRLGEYAVAMLTIFGSVASPDDIKDGKLRKIKASSDTRFLGRRKLSRVSFSESEYRRLLQWSDHNIAQAARRQSKDILESTNQYTVL